MMSASDVTFGAEQLSIEYTNLNSCRSQDLQESEFIYFCRGPAGFAAVFHYFDEKLLLIYGPSGNQNRDEVDPGRALKIDAPISVGGSGKVVGPKIEWLSKPGGQPCAAIVRVSSDAGSVLVVTRLTGSGGRVSVTKSNQSARSSAMTSCRALNP